MQGKSVRVGSFSLGATLLGVGTALLAHNLGKLPKGLELWRFWPILPLLLGVEYLVRQQIVQSKAEQTPPLRLDGISLFLSIFALIAGITYSAVPTTLVDARSLIGLVRPFEYQTQVTSELTDLAGVERLLVSHSAGDVRIEGTDASAITVVATVHTWDTTPEGAENLAQEIKVAVAKGTEARLEISQPPIRSNGPRRWSASYEVRIPKSLLTSAEVSFGNLTVEDITAGKLTVRNGHLKASALRGEVRIVNSFGQVDLQGLNGSLEVDGQNTSIRLADIEGPARVVNEFGSVAISDAGGPLQVINSQGNIVVRNWRAPAGDWDLENRFGSVEVVVPKDASLALISQTRFGSIEMPEWASVARDSNQQSAIGTLGGGEHKLHLQTTNGNLRLSTTTTLLEGGSPPSPASPDAPPTLR